MSLHTSTKVVVYIGGHLCLFSVTAAAKHFFQLFRTNLHFSSSLTTDESLWALSEQGLAPVSSFYVFADQFGSASHPRLEHAPRGASRGAARVCSWQRSKQQAGAGHPQIFMSFFMFCCQTYREDDQAITVLLERNRHAEVLKGLQLKIVPHNALDLFVERFRPCRHLP